MPRFRILHASDLHIALAPSITASRRPTWWDRVRAFFNWLAHLTLVRPLVRLYDLLLGSWQGFPQVALDGHDQVILESFADFALRREECYDLLLLSGDLATTGRPDDLEAARDFFEAPCIGQRSYRTAEGVERKPTLSAITKEKIAILPGNHDRYGPYRYFGLTAPPGSRLFERYFGERWLATRGVMPLADLRKEEGVRLVLLACDFTLHQRDYGNWLPGGWLGQGRVYENQRGAENRLGELICQTRRILADKQAVVLWVIHFDPTLPRSELDAANPFTRGLLLLDRHRLLESAKKEKVPAILCGHSHRPSELIVIDGIKVIVCGTTTAAGGGNQCLNWLEVEIDPSSRVPTFRFQPYQYSLNQPGEDGQSNTFIPSSPATAC